MKNSHSDLVIAGGGIFGLTLAAKACVRGMSVTVLERSRIALRPGTSKGTRNLSVPWAKAYEIDATLFSLSFWEGLCRHVREPVLFHTRQLVVGPKGSTFDEIRDRLVRQTVQHSLMHGDELSDACPLHFPPGAEGLLITGFGYLTQSEDLIDAATSFAVKHGTEILEETGAVGIVPDGDAFQVRTTRGVVRGRHVVCALGPWATGPLLRHCGIALPLYVTREQAIYFRTGRDLGPRKVPFVEDASEGTPGFYVIPALDGRGLKIGAKGFGEKFPFDDSPLTIDEQRVEAVRCYARRLLGEEIVSETVEPCCYTVLAPDYRASLITSPDPAFRQVLAITGDSGSGFKLAPALAELVLARIEQREPGFAGNEMFLREA